MRCSKLPQVTATRFGRLDRRRDTSEPSAIATSTASAGCRLVSSVKRIGLSVHSLQALAACTVNWGAAGGSPVLLEIAGRHGATPAEIALAWLNDLCGGIIPVPGATRLESIASIARARA